MRSKLQIFAAMALLMIGLGAALPHRVTATTPAPSSFNGSWQTTWKSTDGRMVSAPVMIKAEAGNANSLDGTVEVTGPNGTMFGTLSADGKTWSGNWWNPDGVHGTFTFTLKDATHFTGSYTQAGTTGSFVWSGQK